MRRSLLSLITVGLLVVAVAPAADAIPLHWTGKGGRAFTDAARGPDGSLYVAGIDRSSITAAASVRKYSADGTLRWERQWVPSPQASTNGLGVTIGDDGTVYLMGVVRGACEGQGWFVRAYKPGGDLRWKYVTPGWAKCKLAEFPTDIVASGNLVVVSGFSHGMLRRPVPRRMDHRLLAKPGAQVPREHRAALDASGMVRHRVGCGYHAGHSHLRVGVGCDGGDPP